MIYCLISRDFHNFPLNIDCAWGIKVAQATIFPRIIRKQTKKFLGYAFNDLASIINANKCHHQYWFETFQFFSVGKISRKYGKNIYSNSFFREFFVLEVFGGWGSELEDFQEDRGVGDWRTRKVLVDFLSKSLNQRYFSNYCRYLLQFLSFFCTQSFCSQLFE